MKVLRIMFYTFLSAGKFKLIGGVSFIISFFIPSFFIPSIS